MAVLFRVMLSGVIQMAAFSLELGWSWNMKMALLMFLVARATKGRLGSLLDSVVGLLILDAGLPRDQNQTCQFS